MKCEVVAMRKNFRRKLLKISSFLAASSIVGPSASAAPGSLISKSESEKVEKINNNLDSSNNIKIKDSVTAEKTSNSDFTNSSKISIVQETNNNNNNNFDLIDSTKKIIKKTGSSINKILCRLSVPTALLLGTTGLALNEYLGMQGYSFFRPLYFNKGIDSLTKNGIAKNTVGQKDESEKAAVGDFFKQNGNLSNKTYDFTSTGTKGFTKLNPKFNKPENKRSENLCVILRNKKAGTSYIGVPGSKPYKCMLALWEVLYKNNINLAEAVNNKSNPAYEYIEGIISSFALGSFGMPTVKVLYTPYDANGMVDTGSADSGVFSNKKTNGILEIRLDFERSNGGQLVSLSLYSPCESTGILPGQRVISKDNDKKDDNKENIDKNNGEKKKRKLSNLFGLI